MYVDLHSDGGRGGGRGDRREEKVRRIWIESTLISTTVQDNNPTCLTRSASLNAGVTLRLPGVGNAAADIFDFRF